MHLDLNLMHVMMNTNVEHAILIYMMEDTPRNALTQTLIQVCTRQVIL